MLRDKPSLNDHNGLCICFLVFIFVFSGFPHTDRGGRHFERKVLEALGDKSSIELPIAHFIPFDWDTMRVIRYASYTKNLLMDIRGDQIYSLEFRDSSGFLVKEIILPLRFANIVHDGPLTPGYEGISYIWEEKFGRNRKFKITRTENAFRNGGNELKIEIR